MRTRRFRPTRIALGIAATAALTTGSALAIPALTASAAGGSEPTYASATVDGSAGEWTSADVFSPLLSDDAPHTELGTASLRYDCDSGVLYAYVKAADGVVLQTVDPEEDYVQLHGTKVVSGLSGNDGAAPDFAWVDKSGDSAAGFEASAAVAEGSYPASLRIHAKVPDNSADGYQTVDISPRFHNLVIECTTVSPSTTIHETTTTTTTSTTTTTPTTTTTVPTRVRGKTVVKAKRAAPVRARAHFTG
jgi:hypothetical protein